MKRILPLAFVGLFFVSGCVGDTLKPDAQSYEAIRTIRANIEYVGPDHEPVPSTFYPNEILLLFPYIPGEIFGHPTTKPLYETKILSDLTLSIDLEPGLKEVSENSLPLKRSRNTSGLSVLPNSTKLSRIGTFAFDSRNQKALGAGGFIDPVSRDNLILVYVDRACRITGHLDGAKESFTHDITFNSPGFHWIRIHRIGDGKHYLKEYPDNGPATFSIHLLNFERT